MKKRLSYPIYALLCGFLLAGAAHAGSISVDLWEFDSYCVSGVSPCTIFPPATWIENIGTIDDSTLPLGYSVTTLSNLGITLFGDSEYWIGLSTSDSNAEWVSEADDTGLYVSGQSYYNNTQGVMDNSNGAYLMTVVNDWGTEFDSIGSGPLPFAGQDSILLDGPFASFSTADFTDINSDNIANLDSVSVALYMPAPEPGCAWLLGAGLVGLLAWRFRSRIGGRALAATLAVAAGLALSPPAKAQESPRPAIHHTSAEEVSAVRAYWTKERMANAIPHPMPVVELSRTPGEGSSQSTRLRGPEPDITVVPGYDLAGAPAGITAGPDPGPPTIPPPTGTCSSCTTDRSCEVYNSTFAVPTGDYQTLQANLPYSAIGKVFFTQNGVNYVCSGSSIGGSAVLTAGHCVSDGNGNFNTNVAFIPDLFVDSNGHLRNVQNTVWVATHLITFQDYLVNGTSVPGHLGRDVGFAIVKGISTVDGSALGMTLSNSVGHLGFAWNLNPTGVNWNAFGYPVESIGGVYSGLEMVQDASTTACRINTQNPASVGIGTEMANGASGGPWVLDFSPTLSTLSANYVGGLNSYVNAGVQLYSPYFDASVKQLKDVAVSMVP